jgi:hypothetical protein
MARGFEFYLRPNRPYAENERIVLFGGADPLPGKLRRKGSCGMGKEAAIEWLKSAESDVRAIIEK